MKRVLRSGRQAKQINYAEKGETDESSKDVDSDYDGTGSEEEKPKKKMRNEKPTRASPRGRKAVKYESEEEESEEEPEEEEEEKEKVIPKRGGRGRKKVESVKKEEKEDEEEDEVIPPPTKKGRGAPTRGRKAQEVKEEEDDEEEEDTENVHPPTHKSVPRTVLHRGGAVVFEAFDEEGAIVYSAGTDVYSVMLNKTDISQNSNKFYGIQLLHFPGNHTQFTVFLNWGRVGYKGQSSKHKFGSAAKAIQFFCSKFLAKSGLEWGEREEDAVPGKYRIVEVNRFDEIKAEKAEEDEENKVKVEITESILCEEVQTVMRMITDERALARGIKAIELTYDNSEKMPLGKLTDAQLLKGFESLKEIETLLKEGKPKRGDLIHASNAFFSNIPHNFGFRPPPIIDSIGEVELKTELLNTLREVQIAMKTIEEGEDQEFEENKKHPIDRMYGSLKCGMELMKREQEEYEIISSYLKLNHGSSHMFEMKIENIFAVKKFGEEERFQNHLGNKMLLWHGSRLTNMCGILSHGLRIAPPEAPSTGYMFGKGVYFADLSSKSGGYCYPNNKTQAFLLLAEVALGEQNALTAADYKANKLPAGKNSTLGLGKMGPDGSGFKKIHTDVTVPIGKPVKLADRDDCSLLYNEYVVYDEAQVQLRYMVQVTFLTE